jgi:glutamate racemase
MIVVDSGLGGISVVRALRATRPGMPLAYLADTSGFPYGKRTSAELTLRAKHIVAALSTRYPNSPLVLACNTLSTLSLADLRSAFPGIPIVGTVPAIKVAAATTRSKRFTLLATPNTAQSKYSATLIQQFAADCVVDCFGAPTLAEIAERILLGNAVRPDHIRNALSPAFHDDVRGRTDCIVLGCTHYPLILDALTAAAPWPVTFIDSSDAIARRALSYPDAPPASSTAYVTDAADVARYRELFLREGFDAVDALSV